MGHLLKFSLSFILLFYPLSINAAQEDCVVIQEQNYGAIGDTSGKDIFTKVEYTYECTSTTEKKGECVEWREDSNRHMQLPEDKPVAFKDEDFAGGIGQLAMIFAGYSQIQHIWSGWKGLCYDGVVEDFGWMSDPMMWASLIAQAMGAGTNTTGQNQAVSGIGEFSEYAGYAQCTIQMGTGIGDVLNDMSDDEIPCDPIDEFCGPENENSDESVISVTKETFQQMITDNPDFEKYIQIVEDQGAILIIKVIQPLEDLSAMSAEEAANAMKNIKEMMAAVKSVFIAYDAYSCFSAASGGTATNITTNTNDTNPIQGAVTGAINRWIASTGCVPCSIGFTLAVNLVNSFNNVDSCSNKDDAQEQGARHIATYSHKKENMCHFIRKETEEGVFSDLDKYYYCCYNDVFSRILAEQFKAQYAKNWNSCSDITLSEVVNLKMTPCKEGMAGTDPKDIPWNATYEERTSAIQYQNKCVDFTELKNHLQEKFNANIDESMIYEQLEDVRNNLGD